MQRFIFYTADLRVELFVFIKVPLDILQLFFRDVLARVFRPVEVFILTDISIEVLKEIVFTTFSLRISLFWLFIFFGFREDRLLFFKTIERRSLLIILCKRFYFAKMINKMDIVLKFRENCCDLGDKLKTFIVESGLIIFDKNSKFFRYFINCFKLCVVINFCDTFFDFAVEVINLIDVFLHVLNIVFESVVLLK